MDPIVKWLKQELLAYIDSGVSEDDYSYTVQVSHCNILKWFDALDRLSAQQQPDRKQISETGKELPENAEQPMNNADVSVGELAGFFVTEFPHLLTMSTQIEVARALLARYRIERLGCLPSGRR